MTACLNRRDFEFLLHEWLQVESLTKHERFSEHSRATFDPILQAAFQIAEEKFAPHAAKLDEHEPHLDGDRVVLIPEVKEAVEAFLEVGFLSASFDQEVGGLQLPYTISMAGMAAFYGTNPSTSSYFLLTMAGAALLAAHADEGQKERWLRPMLDGRYFATMCLSEPQAGSSLSDVATLAVPQEDGTWRVKGNKMWISCAEHDLSENIVHLVLARTPGAPLGVKGISLMIVPKFLVGEDGRPGRRNDVTIAGVNHKMGYRGAVNCAVNFGENGECVGYLLGERHHGLNYMFHMMNEARIGVGLSAVMLGASGYLYSLGYARERQQGRLPWKKDPASAPVPIIQHADVRRMLLLQKVYVEGGLALSLYAALLMDKMTVAETDEERKEHELLLEILTPIVKAWCSEFCLEANKLAIQVLGGYGYTRDYPVERWYRTNRLNAIHEGTNGIQALDLLGRKVTMQNGAAFRLLMRRIGETIERARPAAELAELVEALETAQSRAIETTTVLGEAAMEGRVPEFLANATPYLEMLGHTVIAWLWLEQALVAKKALGASPSGPDEAFYRGKLHAARFFMRYELPKTAAQATLLQSLDDTTLTMNESWF